MKIVFIGTVEFSRQALQKLLELKTNVVGVITGTNNDLNSDFADLEPLCKAKHIPCIRTDEINKAEIELWIKNLSPDIVFCLGWSRLIKKNILDIPPRGTLGFHPSDLPRNRGRHPLIWPLFLGLPKCGSTFFFLDEGTDSGDIVSQAEVPILDNDDARTLYERVFQTAVGQLEELLPKLASGDFVRIRQDETQATYWRKRGRADGRIDWRMSSKAIANLVRSLTHPYAGAHFDFAQREVKVWKVRIVAHNLLAFQNIEPGKVLSIMDEGNSFDVKVYDGVMRVLDHGLDRLPKVGEYLL